MDRVRAGKVGSSRRVTELGRGRGTQTWGTVLRCGLRLRRGDLACAIEAGLRGRLRELRGGCLVGLSGDKRKQQRGVLGFLGVPKKRDHVVALQQIYKSD